MKPITTPGNASGKVRIATSTLRPKNSERARNTPLMTEISKRDRGDARRERHGGQQHA